MNESQLTRQKKEPSDSEIESEKYIVWCNDYKWLKDKDGNTVYDPSNDRPAITYTHQVYLVEDLGPGKAKYWTDEIEKAYVFNDLPSAIKVVLEANEKISPVSVMSLSKKATQGGWIETD